MTQLEIKNISSPDVEILAEATYALDAVYFLIQLEIGESDDNRQDVFQVMITTPEAMRARASQHASSLLSKRATLVFSVFAWKEIVKEISEIVNSCNAPSWNEAVIKLQRFFEWEYEDFVQSE